MAWSVITDAVLQVGKPIRALTMRLLRDNITALANGDAGAPRVQAAALQSASITSTQVAANGIAASSLGVGTNERDWVLARIAALDAGAVGTPVWAERVSDPSAVIYGNTFAGSGLRPAGFKISGTTVSTGNKGGTLSGTWRALGQENNANQINQTLYVRIA